MKRENFRFATVIYSLLLVTLMRAPLSRAERAAYDTYNDTHDTIMGGIAIVPPAAIERFVRQAIANKLDADVQGPRFTFQVPGVHQQIVIPETDLTLREVMATLGVKKTMNTSVSPIDVQFSLPKSGLELKMQNPRPGIFDVVAKWKVTQITATSKRLNIHVPKGLFDTDFDIDSRPIQISLAKKSPAIQVELKVQVRLGEKGSRLRLVSLRTNLNDTTLATRPIFDLKIGPLTVDGELLTLEIESNGQVLHADEPAIRAQIEKFEPQMTEALRQEINDQLQKYFAGVAEQVSKIPAFKVKLKTDQIVNKPGANPAVQKLLNGIEAEFAFSSLEYVQPLNLFSAHIATHLCLDGQCLFNTGTTPIANDDLRPVAHTSQIGVLIYESWLQRVINDDLFQKRIRQYYNSEMKANGVEIGDSGVKLHLNPVTKSIDAVFNLSIDIRKTDIDEEVNDTNWKRFKARATNELGDLWERAFGTGKYVVMPAEIHFNFEGYQRNRNGDTEMVFKTTLPFRDDGTLVNTYHYPSNFEHLTQLVKPAFMKSLRKSFNKVCPPEIRIPVAASIAAQGVKLPLKKILVSPHRGLVVTAEVPEAK